MSPLLVIGDHLAERAASWTRAGAQAGCESLVCTNGLFLLDRLFALSVDRPVLLLLATDLPGMGARACARAARTLPGRARMPVLWAGPPIQPALPLTEAIPGPDAAALAHAWTRLAPLALAQPLRVLVACSASADRLRLATILNSAGCLVDSAATFSEAQARLKATAVNALLIDIELLPNDLTALTVPWAVVGGATSQAPSECAGLVPLDEPTPMLLALVARWLGDPGPTPEPPILDPTTLAEISEYGREAAESLLETFKIDRAKRLEDLLAAIRTSDAATAIEAAHALKGGAGGLGLARLRRHAAALEHAARSGNLAFITDTYPHLEHLIHEAEAAFATMIAERTCD